MQASDRQLKIWYAKYNAKWFNGELPTKVLIYWKPLSADCGSSCPIFEVEDNVFEIQIDPRHSGSHWEWKIILLHEMVHLRLWRTNPKHQHGKTFRREIHRLVTAGAYNGLL